MVGRQKAFAELFEKSGALVYKMRVTQALK
jgi:hypothetical protein